MDRALRFRSSILLNREEAVFDDFSGGRWIELIAVQEDGARSEARQRGDITSDLDEVEARLFDQTLHQAGGLI